MLETNNSIKATAFAVLIGAGLTAAKATPFTVSGTAWKVAAPSANGAPRPEVAASVACPVVVARDSFGNVLGGIRLSQHAVPTATNTGVNLPVATFCRLFGSFQPFDAATLDMLYPEHGAYVNQVAKTAHQNLKDGFIVVEDAVATIRDAAQSGIGKH